MSYQIETKIGKYEDAQAVWFNFKYSHVEMYSLTVIDAYETSYAKVVTKKELEEFIKNF